MNEAVKTFLTSIKNREHILQLLPETEFSLMLVIGEDRVPLTFKNGEVLLENLQPSYEVSGDIHQLLEGKEPLRTLIRKGQIKISAPFRILLLLESIFYLARGNQTLKEII
jgi:hypothetical protein